MMLHRVKSFFSATLVLFFLLSITAHAESASALFHHAGDPIGGNPHGNVTVVEFFDYQCGHCMAMAPVIEAMIKKNPNVRVVFKDFPVLGAMSKFAAEAALAANLQGKYFSYSHALLTANEPLSPQLIFRLAQKEGLDIEKLKQDMNSKRIQRQINSTDELARALNLSGTPAFFIGATNAQNGQFKFVMGEMSESDLQNAIDQASN